MKKLLFTIFVIIVGLIAIYCFYNKPTQTELSSSIILSASSKNSIDSNGTTYRNMPLAITFHSKSPLYERSSGGFVQESHSDDPHFYESKACSDEYSSRCIAFEIQKMDLPGQSKKMVISSLNNKTPLPINSQGFEFYKQVGGGSGWEVGYIAISKTSDVYYSILTNSISGVFIEKEILPSFSILR